MASHITVSEQSLYLLQGQAAGPVLFRLWFWRHGLSPEPEDHRTCPSSFELAGVDYGGADVLFDTGVSTAIHLWETNPATSGVWDAAAINSDEIGLLSNT